MSCSPVRSSGPGSRNTSSSEMPSSETSSSSTAGVIDSSTSSRTGGPNRRRSSSFSSAASRFSASSSSTSRSSLRVTRKVWASSTSMPGNSRLRCSPMTSSSGTNRCVAERHEAVEDRRHLHPGEVLLAGLGVAHEHREVERQPGDVGERVRRVDRQRRQHREDPVPEQPLAVLLLVPVEVVPAHQLDALVGERRDDLVAEQRGVPLHQLAGLGPDRLEHLAGQQPGGGRDGDAGRDPALEAGDADHEELVEVAGEDRQEPGPLQQRQPRVLGQLEHPLVEVQPGQLAVEEPVLVLLDRVERRRVGDVRRRRRSSRRPSRRVRRPSRRRPRARAARSRVVMRPVWHRQVNGGCRHVAAAGRLPVRVPAVDRARSAAPVRGAMALPEPVQRRAGRPAGGARRADAGDRHAAACCG